MKSEIAVVQGNRCDRCTDIRAERVEIASLVAHLCPKCQAFFIGNDEYDKLILAKFNAERAVESYVKRAIGF